MIRVLIVEDEPLIAEAHRAYVDRIEGFVPVGVAHTGREAMRAAADNAAEGTPIDLVLMDIGLPDASGLDVAAALTGLAPRPDVIAITSARDLAMVRTAVSHGVVLYLLKPFTFAAFRDKLDRYREFRTALPAGETAVSQHDIDRALSALRTPDQRATTPKGVAPQTLDEISRTVRAAPEGITAADTATTIGVSRITAWRYLEKLADDGLVTRRSDYGRAGRPKTRYVWKSKT
ncbi:MULTISPECIES: response regulator [Nocardia]|uniref:Transcriptional regulatory protein n=2 Tax=Nocardia TaxID=1817 RepID=K0EYK2_NOCB7|nr:MULTISPECIES: response regulator [Nocardia]AFU04993.1 two-component system response regulator [Nocardia brasiliensis ATCC 700358]ASF11948.1 response regulator [Nocardia brasiliensis]KIA63105.1 chemotaxis protein CheY [Nocardia vulneris]MBF6124100.1 response regulator [Nocardia brasiliensis]MBF6543913.1 response regulator [Nocardia brasiliensis]